MLRLPRPRRHLPPISKFRQLRSNLKPLPMASKRLLHRTSRQMPNNNN